MSKAKKQKISTQTTPIGPNQRKQGKTRQAKVKAKDKNRKNLVHKRGKSRN